MRYLEPMPFDQSEIWFRGVASRKDSSWSYIIGIGYPKCEIYLIHFIRHSQFTRQYLRQDYGSRSSYFTVYTLQRLDRVRRLNRSICQSDQSVKTNQIISASPINETYFATRLANFIKMKRICLGMNEYSTSVSFVSHRTFKKSHGFWIVSSEQPRPWCLFVSSIR